MKASGYSACDSPVNMCDHTHCLLEPSVNWVLCLFGSKVLQDLLDGITVWISIFTVNRFVRLTATEW